MRWPILLCATAAASFKLSAQIQFYDSGVWRDITVAAQKANGQITAAGTGESWRAWNWNEHWQPSYNNSPWNAWGSGDTAKGAPASMERLGNGAVVSIWDQKDDGSVFCLIHDADGYGASARFAGLHGPASQTRVFVDSRTNFWITEAGLNICTASAQTRAYRQPPPLVHSITTDELWSGGNVTNRLPVSMAEDGRGRIWFWSNCLLGDDSRGTIHGVLTYENAAVTNRIRLDGVPDGRLSVIAPLDAAHLWLAVRDAGIFIVDTDTLRGAPVAEPEPGAFRVVQAIFKEGSDIYVVAGAANEFNDRGLLNSLWRKRDDMWKKLVDGLDSAGSPEQFASRHWLKTADGLWLGAFGAGGWFVPRDGEPSQISWQVGSPLDTIHRWFQPKSGQILALQFGRGGLLADAALLTAHSVKPTAQILQLERPLLQTADGTIFAIRREKEPALSEWDGRQWRWHPFPDNVRLWGECAISADAKGRIWFVDQNYNPDPVLRPTLIFDPATEKFRRFSNFRSALQAEAARLAGSRLGGDTSSSAVFSGDGRVCYIDRTWQLQYFNGREWRQWHLNQIAGGGLWDAAERVPYFADNGKLSLPLNDKIWQLDELAGWQNTGQPAQNRPEQNGIAYARTPDFPEASSIVADRRGLFWAVARGQLYRAGFGLRAPVFPPNEPQPFADGRKITAVLLDHSGNAFLQTSLAGREETVLVPARGPLPEVKLRPREQNEDGVVLELSAPGVDQPRFVWRADDGAWSTASTNDLLRLDELSAGEHRVEIMALDERLQSSPAPAVWKFDVRHTPEQRVRQFITQLGDPDFARRETAIAWLARHRTLSLPSLQAELEREQDAKRRWWLQAAIQQCQ